MDTKNADQLFSLITKSLNFIFDKDHTKPGLLISRVKGKFYLSVHRYKKAFGKEKDIVFKATHSDLGEALRMVAEYIVHQECQDNPIEQLKAFVHLKTTEIEPDPPIDLGFTQPENGIDTQKDVSS